MSQAPLASETVPVPPGLNTFLAIDFGMKRTGIAVGNRLMRTVRALAHWFSSRGRREPTNWSRSAARKAPGCCNC